MTRQYGRTRSRISLKDHLDSRYFDPIKAFEEVARYEGEGFAIVTLHCSLIEFMEATVEGKTYRLPKRGDPPIDEQFEYSKSGDMIVEFLKNRPPFDKMFASAGTAQDFYASVRCGLVHEARTKGTWKIRVCDSAIQAIDANAKVVYRNKMQGAFDQFVDWYGKQLSQDAELQQAFIRKFDSLCNS